MSAKARFLQKLQDKHSCTGPYASKDQADLVAFCQCLGPLQENIETWLAETGITRINNHCALTEMLISNSAFTVPCFELHYENRGGIHSGIFIRAGRDGVCGRDPCRQSTDICPVSVVYAIGRKPELDVHTCPKTWRAASGV
ncbi:hypothetical protein [Serratia proteamaculans]|uniref:hypothetical protein n=1 Tax=Serratia proteamaculans TaxID=28151 RepID=UPI001021418B|nr:hypothetical protein [Serratia proteamaculans]